MNNDAKIPPRLERYELKYVIPASLVEPISDFITAYCELDNNSAVAENYFYLVNSLYFDSPGFILLQNRLWGKDNRFNMRVRAYGWQATPPYFMEVKQKKCNVIIKYRAVLDREEWPAVLVDPAYCITDKEDTIQWKNKALFLRLAASYALAPKVLTQYRRRAFVSVVDEYVRVTMDIDMRSYYQEEYNLVPDSRRMVPYDDETIYDWGGDPGNNVILEIKCYPNQVPTWILALIQNFQLNRRSFSKYVNSLLVSHSRRFCPDINERYSPLYS